MWLNEDVGARFIFFKPGYQAGYGPSYIAPLLTEKYFSAGEIAKEVEIEAGSFNNSSYVKWKGPLGIVELKKAKTREEKLRTMPSPPANYTFKELPILIKFINSEINNLGLKENTNDDLVKKLFSSVSHLVMAMIYFSSKVRHA
jgi:hypothetical protein